MNVTDGSAAKARFATMDAKTAEILREMISAAINTGVEMTAQAVFDVVPDKIRPISDAIDAALPGIVSTAMDAATSPLGSPGSANAVEGIALGAAVAGGLRLASVRHDLYRAGSVLGDAEAIASGSPRLIVRRIGQHVFWRAFGRLGRAIFRGIGGKR